MATQQIQAVRALRRAMHANREYFQALAEFAEADAAFDCGEFGGGSAAEHQFDVRIGEIQEYIAHRFGIRPLELEGAEMAAQYYEIGCMLEGKRAQEGLK